MRAFMVLLTVLLVLPSVLAVGMQIPNDFNDRRTFELNDVTPLQFTVKGENVSQDVVFFVSIDSDALLVEGKKEFELPLNLGKFQTKTVEVDFKGIKETTGYFKVKYGLKYTGSGSGMVGFQQAVKSEFEARVKCTSGCGSSTNHTNTSTGGGSSTSSSTKSAGGGGGGAYIPPKTNTTNKTTTVPVVENENEVSPAQPVVQDVSASQTSTSEMRVNDPAMQSTKEKVEEKVGEVVETAQKGGRVVAIVLLGIIAVALFIQLYTIKVAKEAGQ